MTSSRSRGVSAAVFALGAVLGCQSRTVERPVNTVFWVASARVSSLDPAQLRPEAGYSSQAEEVMRAYETVLAYEAGRKPLTLQPRLAERMPEALEGGSFLIRIRKGVLFHDDPCFEATMGRGRELTAADVVYSWKRIQGFPVSELGTVDRYTLTVRPSRSANLLWARMAFPQASVVPREAVEKYGDQFGKRAVGTGPHRWAGGDLNSHWEWMRGESQKIQVRVITDPMERVKAARDGRADFAEVQSPDSEEVAAAVASGARLATAKGLGWASEVFNSRDPLLLPGSPLRQAIELAVDPREYAVAARALLGGATEVSDSSAPPEVSGMARFKASRGRGRVGGKDISLAKSLLAKAGFPEGIGLAPFEYLATREDARRPLTELVEKSLGEIGLSVRVTLLEPKELDAAIREHRGQLWGLHGVAAAPEISEYLPYGQSGWVGAHRVQHALIGPSLKGFAFADFGVR